MQISAFNGGLSTRIAKHLIKPNEATNVVNLDVTAGSIIPAKGLEDQNRSISKYIYGWRGRWLSSSNYRDYLEYRDSLLWTEEGTYAKKFDGTNIYRLGIAKPAQPLSISASGSSAIIDPVVKTMTNVTNAAFADSATSGSLTPGIYSYKIVNKKGNGVTSIPTVFSYDTSATAIDISNIVGIDGTAYVYRDYAGTYRLVGTTTSTLTDSVLDISANEALLEHTEFPLGSTQKYLYDTNGEKVDYREVVLDANLKTYEIDLAGATTYYREYNGEYREVSATDTVYVTTGALANPYLNGTYQYMYTYYNSVDGTESQPSEYSNSLIVTNQIVAVSNIIASSDPQVDTIRLYRLGGNLTLPTLVTTLPNSSTTYNDKLADIDVDGHLLDSFNYREAPTDMKYLTQSYAIFFGAIGDKLWFSEIGNPNYWPIYNFIDFDADITGIGVVPNGVVVFTLYKTYIITGTNSSTFVKHLVSGEQGCVDHKSIQFADNSILWASQDGICTTSGGQVAVASQDKLGKLNIDNVHNAVVHDQKYYISYGNSVLVLDFRFGVAFYTYSLDVDYIEKYNDELYGHYNGKLYKLFAGDPLSWKYSTGELINQALSMVKLYNDFYISYRGKVSVEVVIDEEVVSTISLDSDTFDTADIAVPSSKQRGYKLQLNLEGSGEVYEIEFKVLGRQNGK